LRGNGVLAVTLNVVVSGREHDRSILNLNEIKTCRYLDQRVVGTSDVCDGESSQLIVVLVGFAANMCEERLSGVLKLSELRSAISGSQLIGLDRSELNRIVGIVLGVLVEQVLQPFLYLDDRLKSIGNGRCEWCGRLWRQVTIWSCCASSVAQSPPNLPSRLRCEAK
jgi:hypothetical protein